MTTDSPIRPMRAVIAMLLLGPACDFDRNAYEREAAVHGEKDAALDPAKGLEDVADSSPFDADSPPGARTEDAGTDASALPASGATPACTARTLASFEAGKEQAKCAAYPSELAKGGDLKLYCSCDLATCPVIAMPPADGAPDKACATLVVGMHCAEALLSTCGLKPGDNDFCAENYGNGRDVCTKRADQSFECTCAGSSEKQIAIQTDCIDALLSLCRSDS